jgi:hypothetical protein
VTINPLLRDFQRHTAAPGAGRLVVDGIRCCLAGYRYEDLACWETAWRVFETTIPNGAVRRLMGELQFFSRTLIRLGRPELRFRPFGCGGLSTDEELVLDFLAALENQDHACARRIGSALVPLQNLPMFAELVDAAESFVAALNEADQELDRRSPDVANVLAGRIKLN